MSSTTPAILWAMTAVTALAAGWIFGINAERSRLKKEIVERGFAEYVLVEGGPKTEFRWNPPIRRATP